MREIRGFCTLCRSQCGTINLVENGKVVTVKADPAHPTGAAVCLKGKSAPEAIAADNRLLYPMRRTRPKTSPDPGWARISWEEALRETAMRLAEIRNASGPEAVAFAVTTKSGTAIADSIEWVDRFVRIFGSPNVAGAVDICNWHKDNAHKFTFGVGTPPADYAHADLMIVWGHNPTSTWLAQSEAISRGRSRGAALIVVDPRCTPLARTADVWLQVRPGTDAALALGLARLVIREQAFDVAFVRRWTNAPLLVDQATGMFLRAPEVWPKAAGGFVVWDEATGAPAAYDTAYGMDERLVDACALTGQYRLQDANGSWRECTTSFDLYTRACEPWTPEAVATTTGVAAATLHHAATLISQNHRIAYHAWNGVGQGPNATQIERSIATLYPLRGCFDDVGGNRIYAKQPINRVDGLNLISKEQLSKAIGLSERPLGPPAEGRVKPIDVYRAMVTGEPYKIRALVGFGTNHLVTQTDVDEIRKGLESCEFHVHCDMVDTPTAHYADIILPICTPWERESLRVGFEISEEAENHVQLRPAMVTPRGESRSDLEVVFDLACRLGMNAEFFEGRVEQGWNHILSPLGITVDDLREADGGISRPLEHKTRKYARAAADGKVAGFATPTRRVELYSELLKRSGYSPVPEHRDRKKDPAFPLVLTSMKNGYFCHSEHRAIPSLRKRSPYAQLFMHPRLAAQRGIAEGAWVKVFSRYGSASFRAKHDESLHHDVIAADFGFWEANDALGLVESPVSGAGNTNFNALVGAALRDPISGSTNHKSIECDIVLDRWFGPPRWIGFRPLQVAQVHWETPTALRILVQSGQDDLPDFLPGQYIKLKSSTLDGEAPVVRAYSLTSPARGLPRSSYEVCVGLDAIRPDMPGRMSSHLHRQLRVGDMLDVQAPAGIFTIPVRSKRPVVLIATGIGITPFISYLETIATQGGSQHPVFLLYGNRNAAQHAFKQRLQELSAQLPQLHVMNFYSQPRPQDTHGSDYDYMGRVDVKCLPEAVVSAGLRAYICGSASVVQAMKVGLKALGVPGHDIFSELFVSESTPQVETGTSAIVEFARSKKRLEWHPSDGTLLSFAEKHGIHAPSGCRVGQCESCLVSVISGKVRHLHGGEPEEPATALTCQAVPDGKVILDL